MANSLNKIFINSLLYVLVITGILFANKKYLFAEQFAIKPKPKIAIMDVKANNCPPIYGTILTEMLTGTIYNDNQFIVLEKNQLDLVLKNKNIDKTRLNDLNYLIKLGKILSVDKIVFGTVNRAGNYHIEIRILNINSSTMDISFSESVDDVGEFKGGISRIGKRIKYHYSGFSNISGNHELLINFAYLYTYGDLTEGTEKGYGLNLKYINNTIINKKISLAFETGLYNLIPTHDSIDQFLILPLSVFIGYKINISDNVKVIPWAGTGYLISISHYDSVRNRPSEEYQYRTEYFYNPLISFQLEANILLKDRYYIAFTPAYYIFFEDNNIGKILGLNLGLKILF